MSPRPLPSEDAAFEPAMALARRGHLEAGLAALTEAASAPGAGGSGRPAAALAFARLAHFAAASGDAALALRALDEAVQRCAGFADLHYRRGGLLLDQQRWAEARAALEKALAINPRFLAARLELALLDAREGRLGESLARLRALAAEQRVKEPHTFEQGLRSLQHADWDEAASLLRMATRTSEREVDRALQMHGASLAEGDPAGALAALREAVVVRPGYPDLHFLLGSAELEAGFPDDALASLARALELNSDFHAARIQFARALETLGSLDQAREQVAQVLRAEPDHAQAHELESRWARRQEVVRDPGAQGRKDP